MKVFEIIFVNSSSSFCSGLLFNRLTRMNYEENFTFLPGIIALNGQCPESVGL